VNTFPFSALSLLMSTGKVLLPAYVGRLGKGRPGKGRPGKRPLNECWRSCC